MQKLRRKNTVLQLISYFKQKRNWFPMFNIITDCFCESNSFFTLWRTVMLFSVTQIWSVKNYVQKCRNSPTCYYNRHHKNFSILPCLEDLQENWLGGCYPGARSQVTAKAGSLIRQWQHCLPRLACHWPALFYRIPKVREPTLTFWCNILQLLP